MAVSGSNVVQFYDKWMYETLVVDLFEESGFNNFGYWTATTSSQTEACENLMEQLLALIPEKKGKILDVACGRGGTTTYLLKYYDPALVTAVNISNKQLQTVQAKIPGCSLAQMNAVKLGFEDHTFDTIVCVEAAFHFDTREDFLREAFRVLKPGGYVVLADLLPSRMAAKYHPRIPEKNWMQDLATFKALCQHIGFGDINIVDVTDECWQGFRKHYGHWLYQQHQAGKVKLAPYLAMALLLRLSPGSPQSYFFLSARKG